MDTTFCIEYHYLVVNVVMFTAKFVVIATTRIVAVGNFTISLVHHFGMYPQVCLWKTVSSSSSSLVAHIQFSARN